MSFQFRDFQLDDIARAALVDGLIFAPEQGLGKTVCSLAWAVLKEPKHTLIIAPEQLHGQWKAEARDKLALHLSDLPQTGRLRFLTSPFYITSYTSLAVTRAGALGRALRERQLFDCVMIDEGTRIQADDSLIGACVRHLHPRFRAILTATPVKDRIGSLYWLLRWITESGSKSGIAAHRTQKAFVAHFSEVERRPNGRKQPSTRICNIHELWKLIAPCVLRRRKADCSHELVPMTIHPMIIQPGTAQLAVYRYHLNHPPRRSRKGSFVEPRVRVGMQLNLLRKAALCPHAAALADSRTDKPANCKRSWTDLTPKHAALFSLIISKLNTGRQVLIGSPFVDFNHSLHRRLLEAGVSSVLLDGTTDPVERAVLTDAFKAKKYAVGVAGEKAFAEGVSAENCSTLVLAAPSWAFDENDQFIHRVWRLNSPEGVEVYLLVTQNTIEEYVHRLHDQKHAAASMAIDGQLPKEKAPPLDPAGLLHEALSQFNPKAPTIDESAIESAWPNTKFRLSRAELRFREFWPEVVSPLVLQFDIQQALDAQSLKSPTHLSVALARNKHLRHKASK